MKYMIDLQIPKPPLNANQRLHWAEKAREVRDLRHRTNLLARAAQLPTGCERVMVRLVYQPRDKRRRDPSNLMPTQKAVLDGLVDYGLVPDDCPPYVVERMPRLLPPEKGKAGKVWVEVEVMPYAVRD